MQDTSKISNRNTILFLLFLGQMLSNLDRFVINYGIVPISEDLQLSSSATGLVLSAFFAGFAIMQMPGGWLADRFGARKIIITTIIAWSLFTGLTAVAWSLSALLIIRFLFGIGEGGFYPASAKMITMTFPVERRSRAISILLSSATIAGIVAPVFAASMINSVGWRPLFFSIGVIGVFVGLIYWFFLKPTGTLQQPSMKQDEIAQKSAGEKGGFKVLFKMPMMWSLMLASFSMFFISWGTASWLPTYLMNERGLDLMSLGLLQMIPAAASLIFMLFAGYLVDILTGGREKWLGAISAVAVAVLVYLMFNAQSMTAFIIYQTLMSLFTSTGAVIVSALPMKRLPVGMAASGIGMVTFGGQLSGFFAPLLIGFILDLSDGSFNGVVWLLVSAAIVSCIAFTSIRYNED